MWYFTSQYYWRVYASMMKKVILNTSHIEIFGEKTALLLPQLDIHSQKCHLKIRPPYIFRWSNHLQNVKRMDFVTFDASDNIKHVSDATPNYLPGSSPIDHLPFIAKSVGSWKWMSQTFWEYTQLSQGWSLHLDLWNVPLSVSAPDQYAKLFKIGHQYW